jgi:hypothetical protein
MPELPLLARAFVSNKAMAANAAANSMSPGSVDLEKSTVVSFGSTLQASWQNAPRPRVAPRRPRQKALYRCSESSQLFCMRIFVNFFAAAQKTLANVSSKGSIPVVVDNLN